MLLHHRFPTMHGRFLNKGLLLALLVLTIHTTYGQKAYRFAIPKIVNEKAIPNDGSYCNVVGMGIFQINQFVDSEKIVHLFSKNHYFASCDSVWIMFNSMVVHRGKGIDCDVIAFKHAKKKHMHYVFYFQKIRRSKLKHQQTDLVAYANDRIKEPCETDAKNGGSVLLFKMYRHSNECNTYAFLK